MRSIRITLPEYGLRGGLVLNLIRVAILGLVLLLWELTALYLVSPFWISSPSLIFWRLVKLIGSGLLLFHLSITLTEMLIGFSVGSLVGISAGFVLGRLVTLREVLEPYLMALYSIPRSALAPLFIILIGIGMESKIAISALFAFFFTLFNTIAGVRNVEQELVNIIKVMGASEMQLLKKVVFPAATPFIIAGLKSAVPFSLVGAIIGEFISSNKGIGYFIMAKAVDYDTTGSFAGIFSLAFFIFFINAAVNWLDKRVLGWRRAV